MIGKGSENGSDNKNTTAPLLRLAIPDLAVLRACYMPFLQGKGLFVPGSDFRELGEKLFLILRLGPQALTVAGSASVCWWTPPDCSDGREAGLGLHFLSEPGTVSPLQDVIEALLRENTEAGSCLGYTL